MRPNRWCHTGKIEKVISKKYTLKESYIAKLFLSQHKYKQPPVACSELELTSEDLPISRNLSTMHRFMPGCRCCFNDPRNYFSKTGIRRGRLPPLGEIFVGVYEWQKTICYIITGPLAPGLCLRRYVTRYPLMFADSELHNVEATPIH